MEAKKLAIYTVAAVLIISSAFIVIQRVRSKAAVPETPVKAEKDFGAIKVTGELPGYDIDKDGGADYLKSGLFPYVELYKKGGFNYSGGSIEILETNTTIILPPMYFLPSDMTESGVGGYVIFVADGKTEQGSPVGVFVRVSAFGRQVNSYVVSIAYPAKDLYILRDIADGKTPGTFEKEEITGPGMIRL